MKSTKEMIEVMLAFADGAPIEYSNNRTNSSWMACLHPIWDWNNFDYRVAPEKAVDGVVYVVTVSGGGFNKTLCYKDVPSPEVAFGDNVPAVFSTRRAAEDLVDELSRRGSPGVYYEIHKTVLT